MHLKILLCSFLLVIGVLSQEGTDSAGGTIGDSNAEGVSDGGGGKGDGSGDGGKGGEDPGKDGNGGGDKASEGKDGGKSDVDLKAGKEEKRQEKEIAAPELDVSVPAVLVKSKDVPYFDEFSSTFSTLYPMTCGGSVNIVPSIEGKARWVLSETLMVCPELNA
ncbi:hypothetical protein ANCCAN_05153 [Ancylostoma caninum]|uniref:Uncharacterized protein n=1 Tax=Ancylostoma caninum TaxID=29170 RepID=A0A368GWF5_ANCCA|nr:hypothetical protein ANCCAN_05153 [Ancylostoma caninum]